MSLRSMNFMLLNDIILIKDSRDEVHTSTEQVPSNPEIIYIILYINPVIQIKFKVISTAITTKLYTVGMG